MTDNQTEYWRVEDVARHLRCHVQTVKRWMRLGMPYRRVGPRNLLFVPSEVRQWVDAQQDTATVSTDT